MTRIKKIPFQQKAERYRVNNAFLAALSYWVKYSIVIAMKECEQELEVFK